MPHRPRCPNYPGTGRRELADTVSRGGHVKRRYYPPRGSFQPLALDDGGNNESVVAFGIGGASAHEESRQPPETDGCP